MTAPLYLSLSLSLFIYTYFFLSQRIGRPKKPEIPRVRECKSTQGWDEEPL